MSIMAKLEVNDNLSNGTDIEEELEQIGFHVCLAYLLLNSSQSNEVAPPNRPDDHFDSMLLGLLIIS